MKYIDLAGKNITFGMLLKQDEVLHPKSWPGEKPVTRFVLHSSDIQQGDVYFAIPPLTDEEKGQRYLEEALHKKPSIIIKQKDIPLPCDSGQTLIIDIDNARQKRALIARRLFKGQPSCVVGVTGTNGKTSVVNFCQQLWAAKGYASASLGTLGLLSDRKLSSDFQSGLTSPDPFQLHQTLAQVRDQGITHLAIEASSHGLHQHRLDGITFASGAFTNLSQDHLDYHGNMHAYFDAKARFFSEVIPSGESAILNADTNYFEPLAAIAKQHGLRVISYGKRAEHIQLLDLSLEGNTQIAQIAVMRHNYKVRLNFIGKFQVLNALCAMGLLIGTGEQPHEVIRLLEALKPVPGRLELMGMTKNGAAVYVDYAHTPDALHEALLSIRPYVNGVLTVLFGCGGDRDQQKRPMMGKIAGQFSDAQIITDDNPRNEDPALIRKSILSKCPGGLEIGDRGTAIETALQRMAKHDAVLIAGKGHEQYQIIGKEKIPFDDREIVRRILRDSGGKLAA